MKLALLADSHSNLVALQTVIAHIDAWQPDAVVVAGDVINRGPQPLECLELVLQRVVTHGWRVLKGNHEDYVLAAYDDAQRSAMDREIMQISHWTLEQLRGNHAFAYWPDHLVMQAPDGGAIHFWHASPLHNRDCIWPAPRTSDDELRRKLGSHPPRVLGVGHTHIPITRICDHTLVVNCGSVGIPFDGDPRASYARMYWDAGHWTAEIVRLDYDRTRVEHAYRSSSFLDVPLARLVLREFQNNRPLLGRWDHLYSKRIRAGEISVAQSVQDMLDD